jgi:cbb3-type cytochrome oxidase maturation protein
LDIIYTILPLTLLLAVLALGAFVWAVRRAQFDDLETPAVRILFDDAEPAASGDRPKENIVMPEGSGRIDP